MPIDDLTLVKGIKNREWHPWCEILYEGPANDGHVLEKYEKGPLHKIKHYKVGSANSV